MIEEIKELLEKFTFVKWDRYTNIGTEYSIYGWIERNDQYKDFIVLNFFDSFTCKHPWFITSSVKYDTEITRILKQEGNTTKCQRVEHLVDIKDSIKL